MNQNLENISPTPVAKQNLKKQFIKNTIFALGGMIVVTLLLPNFFPKKENLEEEKPSVTSTDTTQHLTAPQLIKPPEEEKKPFLLADIKPSLNINKEDEKLEKMRLAAPMSVMGENSSVKNRDSQSAILGNNQNDTNTQFMNQLNATHAPIVEASTIAHPSTTLAQGTIISATLETRIQSDLPGMIRAVTANNIYSEDGSNLLLPKGSRLIGQYTNAILQGQERVFVVWQRAIRPDHIDIQLTSPGTDALGTAGISAAVVDKHFFEQFGMSALFSLISAGAANVGVDKNVDADSKISYQEAVSQSFAQTAEQTLQQKGSIKPTLIIHQGTKINVFVARDLDFWRTLFN